MSGPTDDALQEMTHSAALDRLEHYAQRRGQMIEYCAELGRKVEAAAGNTDKLAILFEALETFRREVNR